MKVSKFYSIFLEMDDFFAYTLINCYTRCENIINGIGEIRGWAA